MNSPSHVHWLVLPGQPVCYGDWSAIIEQPEISLGSIVISCVCVITGLGPWLAQVGVNEGGGEHRVSLVCDIHA